jgi:2-oxo-3-hexenedioate decarboxylase
MGFSRDQLAEMAAVSLDAEFSRHTIPKFTIKHPGLTLDDGYEIQEIRRKLVEQRGHHMVGGKMGLTSKEKMKQVGVDKPSYGILFDYMGLAPDAPLRLDDLIQPRIEPEITFVMKKDLTGPGVTSADVMDAADYVTASLEIIDSRFENFQFLMPDVVADNTSSARYKLGELKVSPLKLDLTSLGVVVSKNGEDGIFASSGAVLGHPARAIAEYVNLVHRFGHRLKAGEFVLSGAITAAIPVVKGDIIKAEFQNLGSVEVRVE